MRRISETTSTYLNVLRFLAASYLLSVCTEAQRGKVKQRLRGIFNGLPANRSSQAY